MAMLEIRRVRLDNNGDFRPVGKRTRWIASEDHRLVVDGVYMLPGCGSEYYRVEKKLGGEPDARLYGRAGGGVRRGGLGRYHH